MAVRLSKVIRELNVGVSTAVEFLQKKGFGTVEADSNAKITDEQYDALVKEFGKDDAMTFFLIASDDGRNEAQIHGISFFKTFYSSPAKECRIYIYMKKDSFHRSPLSFVYEKSFQNKKLVSGCFLSS